MHYTLSFHGDIFLFIYLFCYFFFPVGPQMAVQLEVAPGFTAVPVGKDHDSYCLGANGRHTSSWLVTPKSLGEWKMCKGAPPRKGESRKDSSVTFFSLDPHEEALSHYCFWRELTSILNTRQALEPLLEPRIPCRSWDFGRCQVPGRSELSSLDCLFQGMWISLCLRKHNSPQSPVVLRWPQFLRLGERTQ